MKLTRNLVSFFIILVVLFSCKSYQDEPGRITELEKQLNSLRVKYDIPAIAYGVVRNDSIIVKNVIGYRNIEIKEKAQTDDLFHIGSNTKSFTAFLAAKLVEDGHTSWDTRFFDLYPELKAESNPAYCDITLQQLLSHRARLIPFKNESEIYPIVDYERTLDQSLSLPQKRYQFIKQVLKYEPIPLYDYHDDRYSNAGYIAAALMLEKVAGKSWEELIGKVSGTLNLGLYVGWPLSKDPDQPRGHINPEQWLIDIEHELIPIPEVLKRYHYFNQYILLCTPSGHTSITVSGFLEFLLMHIEGLNGKDNYLKSETYKHLLASYPDYSLGWAARLFNRTCYHHRGSAGTFNSIALILPDSNTGIVIMINTYDGEGINEITRLLIDHFEE